jgi:hypothetical protein
VNGGRTTPWKDAYGVPLWPAARVEQVAVNKAHGALNSRLGKRGTVDQFRQARVAVVFDGETTAVAVHPYLLHVIEQGSEG